MRSLRWLSVVLVLAFHVIGVAGPRPAVAQIHWTVAPEFAPPAAGSAGPGGDPEFGDLDADGDYDLIYGAVLQSYRNLGTPEAPSWEEDSSLIEGVEYLQCMTACLADLDADGDLDLSAGLLYGEAFPLWYWVNVGTPAEPVWQLQYSMYEDLPPGNWTCPELADLDGDGDLDLMLAVAWGLRVYRNEGTPEAPSWERDDGLAEGISVSHAYVHPSAGDLDGDGDLDLVIGGRWGEGPIVCYENVGTPQAPLWAENESMLEGVDRDVEGNGVDLADLDADGDPDLLSRQSPGGAVVYLNCGPITPVEPTTWGRIKGLFRER